MNYISSCTGISLLLLSIGSSAQNVGIGTVSPSEKLHVNGNIKGDTLKPGAIKFSLNAGNGKILTSDVSGNASWQERTSSTGSAGFGSWGDCSMNNISEYYPVGDTAAVVNDLFGHSVAMAGNYAIVGVPYDDIGPNANQGSVNVYQFDGTNWLLDQKLTDTAGATNDQFGLSVAISGNFLLIGSNGDDVGGNVDQGSVCIYLFNGTEWEFMQKITDPAGVAGDNFGYSVSISGNNLIVGVPFDDPAAIELNYGSACFYQFDGVQWIFTQKVFSVSPGSASGFGSSVSIYGNNAVVGSPHDYASQSGSALFYQLNGSVWEFKIKMYSSTGYFGSSVGINDSYAIVGAPGDYSPESNAYAGLVYIYKLTGSGWSLLQKLYDANGQTGDNFGASIAISGNYLIIGASYDKIGQNIAQGSSVIYQRTGSGWKKLQLISDPGGSANDKFGFATAIDDYTRRFIISERDYLSGTGIVVFGKVNN